MDEEDETAPADVQEELGVSPALAGAAAFEGLPRVMSPLLGDAPHGLAQFLMSGEPIKAVPGTPLSRLAQFTRAEADAIADFARQQGVTIPIVAGGPDFDYGYHMDQPGPLRRLMTWAQGQPAEEVLPHIGLKHTSVPGAMHEIGHATPIAGSHDLRRILQLLGRSIGTGSLLGHGLRAGIASSALLPPGEDASSGHRFVYEHAPALVAATTMPELVEEARASIHALRGARSSGYGTMRALTELAPAFGTYVAQAAAPVLATIFAKKLVEALRGRAQEKQDEEKNAAPMAGAEVKAPGALRASASSAWRMGTSPPKPKSIGPGEIGKPAKERTQAKPPSKQSFYKDMLQSLYNPQRGSRLATPPAG